MTPSRAERLLAAIAACVVSAALVVILWLSFAGCSGYSDCGDAGCGCESNSECGYSEICSGGECWSFETKPTACYDPPSCARSRSPSSQPAQPSPPP